MAATNTNVSTIPTTLASDAAPPVTMPGDGEPVPGPSLAGPRQPDGGQHDRRRRQGDGGEGDERNPAERQGGDPADHAGDGQAVAPPAPLRAPVRAGSM